MTRKLPPIPKKEWIILGIGVTLFAISQATLMLNGYSDLTINTIVSFVLASMIAYLSFAVKNKLKLIAEGLTKIASLLLAIPLGLLSILFAIPLLFVKMINLFISFLNKLPSLLIALLEFIPYVFGFIGTVLLNVALVPVLAIYFTIYGMIFSLSGSMAKIMLKHYYALGERMMKPFEKHLHLEVTVFLVVISACVFTAAEILSGVNTSLAVTDANSAAFAAGNGLTAMGTVASYLPVFIILIFIVAIAAMLRFFFTGMGAYARA